MTERLRFPETPVLETLNGVEVVKASPHLYWVCANTHELSPKKSRQILVISGPPGAGKDTIVEALMLFGCFGRPKTATTRLQRPKEISNDPYIRMTEAEFIRARDSGAFIEHDYHGAYYGSPKEELARVLDSGLIPIMRVDPNGALSFRTKAEKLAVQVISVFVSPPREVDLYKRLYQRQWQNCAQSSGAIRDSIRDRWPIVMSDLSRMHEAHLIAINPDQEYKTVAQEIVDLL